MTTLKFRNNDKVSAKVFILESAEDVDKIGLRKEEADYVRKSYDDDKKKTVVINRYTECFHIFFIDSEEPESKIMEQCRRKGASICKSLNANKYEEVLIQNIGGKRCVKMGTAEGMMLANYEFNKYKTDAKSNTLKTIYFLEGTACNDCMEKLNITVEATLMARDLVNEPVNHLNAQGLAEFISEKVRSVGGEAEVFNKKKIEALRMGGLLAVNAGSIDEPTFTILEWKPEHPVNEKPIVLVGKGIVFDTGGYNLKSATYMNDMKDDMSGAATVACTVYAVAKAKLPVHVIALVPATDNRLDGNAHVTGDVITMYDGTTVEVLNTDAEGRLILADALAYAKKYDPIMVFDFATLTGAASNAIGPVATVAMEHNAEEIYKQLETVGERVYERLVKFPMWEEYGELIKSDIADIKNIGGKFGGAITAGKFLEHFTDYPWVHFDIAGPAYIEKPDHYKTAGGTGIHVRLLMRFLRDMVKKD
ncbi:MAG: leucyl aminopeptidase [Bacteroidales bacterium]|nr:leucyl aminopeptidase [Bacteroidales bacterium]